jgi:exopolysaccharide biosynthesis polyprenyl glycosylphosphotransferase
VEHNRTAAANVRAHAARGVCRVLALLLTDFGAFEALRTTLALVRYSPRAAQAVGAVKTFVQASLPEGYLGGWQFAAALLLGLFVTGSYGPGDRRRDARRILAACALATALPLWSRLWTEPALTIGQYVLTVTLMAVALVAGRLLLDAILTRYAPHPLARTILVGPTENCLEVWHQGEFAERQGFDLRGYVALDESVETAGARLLYEMRRRIVESRADTVMLCGQLDEATFTGVVRTAVMAECRVLASMRRLGQAGLRPSIVWRRGRPLVELRAVALRGHQLFVKRVLDVVLSAALLVAFLPVILLVALAVRLGSKGPVIYGQRRLGRHGRSFRCFKFRSMYPDAEQRLKTDPALYAEYLRNDYKLPDGDDPRITPVGRLLRRTSLDELPQLWNVLRGDMSLVGPRPIVPDEIRHYEAEGPMLLLLKPGITGLWQVSGRSNVAYPERTGVELDYVERWNLMGDVGILLRTVPAVLMQRGAH